MRKKNNHDKQVRTAIEFRQQCVDYFAATFFVRMHIPPRRLYRIVIGCSNAIRGVAPDESAYTLTVQ